MEIAKILRQRLGVALLENEPMAKHTTFKIGGLAKFFVQGKTSEIAQEAYRAVKEFDLPYFVLGSGSNILVSDNGFDGLVINLQNNDFAIEDEKVKCGAGLPLARLVKKTIDAALTGCEWAIVIPGSVGGSIRGNSGAYGGEFSKIVDSVTAFDGQTVRTYGKDEIGFNYRESAFKHEKSGEIILSATLSLKKGDKTQARQAMLNFLNKKNTEHPMGMPSAGCCFKNVELIPGSYVTLDPSCGHPTDFFKSEVPQEFVDRGNVPAGFLIEAADLKGYQIGGVQVSTKHANYTVNINGGRAEDVIILTGVVKQRIKNLFGVQLKEEIQLVGF